MKLLSPYDSLVLIVSILAVVLVDDGMLWRNNAAEESPRPLPEWLDAAEQSAQSWERLLFASGGALELSKCFAYIIYWDLSPSKAPQMLEPHELPDCSPEGDHFRGPIGLTHGDVSSVHRLLVTESDSTDFSLGQLERRIRLSTKARARSISPHGVLLSGERDSSSGIQDDGLPGFRISVDCHTMQRLNACRMYLRVSRLSEIATAQGTKLRSAALQGNEESIHHSEARWPRQARPVAADWTFWSKMLQVVFSNDGAPKAR
jgi:hypothetical protein